MVFGGLKVWIGLLFQQSVELLDRPFSEEKIHNAVLHLNKEKAPGPDGFTIAFYQDCWEMIKDDLLRVFLEFHNNGIINQSTNATFIALVPKKSQTSRILDYRPIKLVYSKREKTRPLLDQPNAQLNAPIVGNLQVFPSPQLAINTFFL